MADSENAHQRSALPPAFSHTYSDGWQLFAGNTDEANDYVSRKPLRKL